MRILIKTRKQLNAFNRSFKENITIRGQFVLTLRNKYSRRNLPFLGAMNGKGKIMSGSKSSSFHLTIPENSAIAFSGHFIDIRVFKQNSINLWRRKNYFKRIINYKVRRKTVLNTHGVRVGNVLFSSQPKCK